MGYNEWFEEKFYPLELGSQNDKLGSKVQTISIFFLLTWKHCFKLSWTSNEFENEKNKRKNYWKIGIGLKFEFEGCI